MAAKILAMPANTPLNRSLRSMVLWVFAMAAMPICAQDLPLKIRLHANGESATATLADNATARDFVALLPLSIPLRDFAKVERVADLPRTLSTAGAPARMAPVAGDIAYYAPLNHLVFFVGSNVAADGLVRMGRVDTGLAALQRPGSVRIERLPN